MVSFLSENILDDNVDCVSYHINTERKTGKQYLKAISFVFVELFKFGNSDFE